MNEDEIAKRITSTIIDHLIVRSRPVAGWFLWLSKKTNQNLGADELKCGKGADLFKVVVVLLFNFE
jgi:hypothetical protein